MTVAEWDSVPLVPVMVTVYTPADPLQDRLEVPDAVRLVGVRVQVRPVAGVIVDVRPTTPLKPWREVIVIVEVPAALAFVETDVGLAATVKSCTV